MKNEFIRLDTTIIGIDSLINKASTAEEVKVLFAVKDVIYSQQRYFTNVQPVEHEHGETTYKPIESLEDIKTICSTHLHCQGENEYCEFFDKDSGYCIFDDMPEDWEIEKNKRELLDALKKAGVKMDGDSKCQ